MADDACFRRWLQDLFSDDDQRRCQRGSGSTRLDEESINTWCPECGMWLNGPQQLQDHEAGRRHQKNLQRRKPLKEPPAGPCSAFQGSEHDRQQAIEALEQVIIEQVMADIGTDSDFESALSPKPTHRGPKNKHPRTIAPSPSGCMGRSCEREINATCTYCRLQFCPWHWAQCGLCAAFICNPCCQRHRQECKSTCVKINAMLAFQSVGSGCNMGLLT